MTYDFVQYGRADGDEMVSQCCRAQPRIEKEYGGLVVSAIECSACGWKTALVPNTGIDTDELRPNL